MTAARAFIAGSTGATGRNLQRIARRLNIDHLPHVRPKSAQKAPEYAAIFELSDCEQLTKALKSCTTVVQLIGTMQKRFSLGDTYESSDIGTTQLLVDAAKNAGTEHIVLLSSVGAGRPYGRYLKAKARAEAIVRESQIAYTIFRPSMFEGDYHGRIPGAKRISRLLGLKRYEPIPIEELAGTILYTTQQATPKNRVLEGQSLWAEVEKARQVGYCLAE